MRRRFSRSKGLNHNFQPIFPANLIKRNVTIFNLHKVGSHIKVCHKEKWQKRFHAILLIKSGRYTSIRPKRGTLPIINWQTRQRWHYSVHHRTDYQDIRKAVDNISAKNRIQDAPPVPIQWQYISGFCQSIWHAAGEYANNPYHNVSKALSWWTSSKRERRIVITSTKGKGRKRKARWQLDDQSKHSRVWVPQHIRVWRDRAPRTRIQNGRNFTK